MQIECMLWKCATLAAHAHTGNGKSSGKLEAYGVCAADPRSLNTAESGRVCVYAFRACLLSFPRMRGKRKIITAHHTVVALRRFEIRTYTLLYTSSSIYIYRRFFAARSFHTFHMIVDFRLFWLESKAMHQKCTMCIMCFHTTMKVLLPHSPIFPLCVCLLNLEKPGLDDSAGQKYIAHSAQCAHAAVRLMHF